MPRAGLAAASVTHAGAAVADDVGFEHLSMGLVAERLGVRTPSLYNHVDGLADLIHRIAVLAMIEMGDAVRDATAGRAGREAIAAAAQSWRAYVKRHPGRYAAANSARPTGPDDPLLGASTRVLTALSAALSAYHLDPGQEIHALRMLRSALHGFATLEAVGGFQFDTDIDESFTWMMALLEHGLQSPQGFVTNSSAV